MNIIELPKEMPKKPKYVKGFDNYRGATFLNKTEIMDKNLLGHKKVVLQLYSQK